MELAGPGCQTPRKAGVVLFPGGVSRLYCFLAGRLDKLAKRAYPCRGQAPFPIGRWWLAVLLPVVQLFNPLIKKARDYKLVDVMPALRQCHISREAEQASLMFLLYGYNFTLHQIPQRHHRFVFGDSVDDCPQSNFFALVNQIKDLLPNATCLKLPAHGAYLENCVRVF